MRVLFVTNTIYPPQRAGGALSSVHDLCIELQKTGVSVAVLAALRPGDITYAINRIRYKIGARKPFPVDVRMGYPVFRDWTAIEGVEEVIQRFEPMIVFTQNNSLNFVEAFLATGTSPHYSRQSWRVWQIRGQV